MTKYEPEIGQLCFGQPWKCLDLDGSAEDALNVIAHAFDVARINSPFNNSGTSYKNNTFEAHSYSWSDEEQPFNFKWRDFEASWYKYFARGASMNRQMDRKEAHQMMVECIMSLEFEEEER